VSGLLHSGRVSAPELRTIEQATCRRAAASQRTHSFPIYTLDERKLTPALGYVCGAMPGLSPFASLSSMRAQKKIHAFERVIRVKGG
jgi:hypothetical protein